MKPKVKNTLRVGHYNIYNGGKKKVRDIFSVIKKMNLDICGILEAVDWQKNESYYKKEAKKIGFKIFFLAQANSKYNIAVISKVDLDIKTIKNNIRHVVVKTTIKDKDSFAGLNIFFLHLSPKLEKDRLKELEVILKYIKKGSSNILIGDFNSLSTRDAYNHKKLLESLRMVGVQKFGVKKLNFSVIKKLENRGFVDIFKLLNKNFKYSVPTPYNKDISHSVKLRIDYAFISKNLKSFVKESKIVQTTLSKNTSDHYPFLIELKK